MKLATLKDGSRDGKLIVVSGDLARAVSTQAIAVTMQAALDDWANVEPQLQSLAAELNAGTITGSGTVSNADRSAGSACINERRVIEMLDVRARQTSYGSTIR